MLDTYSGPLKIVLVVMFIFLLFFVYTTVVAANKYHKVRRALKNSEIVCEPVKIDNDYFCSTSILINVHGVDDTFSVDKVGIDE